MSAILKESPGVVIFFAIGLMGFLVSGLIGGALLASRDRAGLGFVLGALLGPVGWIIAAVMRLEKTVDAAPARPRARLKKCPQCAEMVQLDARMCRFCRSDFASLPTRTQQWR